MFEREARLHAAVTHDNVVTVFHAGVDARGEPYLAMEYIDGVDGYRLLRRLRQDDELLPVGVAIYVAREVLRALESVHAARDPLSGGALGIVHRDVSPSNIYLSKDGKVKLGDFGIARSTTRTTLRSEAGQVLKGKFAYLAPEQVAGEPSDHRADLFSLGDRARRDAPEPPALPGRRPARDPARDPRLQDRRAPGDPRAPAARSLRGARSARSRATRRAASRTRPSSRRRSRRSRPTRASPSARSRRACDGCRLQLRPIRWPRCARARARCAPRAPRAPRRSHPRGRLPPAEAAAAAGRARCASSRELPDDFDDAGRRRPSARPRSTSSSRRGSSRRTARSSARGRSRA